jgi:hypothetical protein
MMDKNYIFSEFKKLKNNKDKVKFILELKSYNLPYNINYNNLIKYYREN